MKVDEMLEDFRKITMLTGEISSVHVASLKQWPYVAFNGVQSVEVEYDLTKETVTAMGEGSVVFKLTVDPAADNEKMFAEICAVMTGWVRDMFWPEIKVSIYFNGIRQFSDSTIKEKDGPK